MRTLLYQKKTKTTKQLVNLIQGTFNVSFVIGLCFKEEQLKMGVQQSTYEGPTTITYLVSQEAERMGIETRTFVAHLPQYLDIEDDFVGTAKLVEILCNLYELPEHLIDKQKGSDQYAKLQDTIATTEGMPELMEKLEERYDNSLTDESNSPIQLSPDIEDFLKELGEDI